MGLFGFHFPLKAGLEFSSFHQGRKKYKKKIREILLILSKIKINIRLNPQIPVTIPTYNLYKSLMF